MSAIDEPLASGRDADIFAVGDDLVLRRSRRGRSMAGEAELMTYLAERGFPVPRVESVSDDGTEMTMERLRGPGMIDALGRKPWRAGYHGRTLGTLLERLHAVPVPDWLEQGPGPDGGQIVHLDLHPMNVILTDRGPMVIDWANAAAGCGPADVATSWMLIASGQVDANPIVRRILGRIRRGLIAGLLSVHERRRVAQQLPAMVAWKTSDPNISEAEADAMRELAASESDPHG